MKYKFSAFLQKAGLAWFGLNYAPVLFAADNWFPTVATEDDMTKNGNSAMTVLSGILKKGFMVLLFATCMVTFLKFISTVSHGIEEAKRNEGGSMAVFANFAFLAIVYLTVSIATGYLGYTVVNNFKV